MLKLKKGEKEGWVIGYSFNDGFATNNRFYEDENVAKQVLKGLIEEVDLKKCKIDYKMKLAKLKNDGSFVIFS